jgi:DNA/RNA-binding domain of Phe-tRNA-synthetase-like protein
MSPINLSVSNEIYSICPEFTYATIQCKVVNSPTDENLWTEIHSAELELQRGYKTEDINKIPAIQATRKVYKLLGKDPNRYRPSAEALCRRIVKGVGIYKIHTLVDMINLVSIRTGYSIGGFDADRIQGNLMLGVGEKDETFEAIGRGVLNIEGLPVYRDFAGGIGTPTSDEERTKISEQTSHLLMIINGYSGPEGIEEATDSSVRLLEKYAKAKEVDVRVVKPL